MLRVSIKASPGRVAMKEVGSLIAVSRRLATVEKTDIIYMREDGRVVESGTYTELGA